MGKSEVVNFPEVINRAYTGPFCSEEEYSLDVFAPKVKELVGKYGIKYDPENVVPSDDDLADRVFRAGLELYAHVGTYCDNTQRIIKFTEAEIRKALATAPSAPIFGEGKDAKTLVGRKPESNTPPWCFLGGGSGAAVSNEEIFESIVQAGGELPLADSITTPSLATLDGVPVRAGSPLEILACIKSVRLAREALRKSGRPGLAIMNSIATAVSDQGKIAGSQFGLRPTDGWLIGSAAEMKVDFERLNEIVYVSSLGGHIVAEASPILGGYCGGPEGVAVTNVAYHLQAILVFRGSAHHAFPLHSRYSCTTERSVLWAIAVSSQAISMNSHFPLLNACIAAGGPETEMGFYEQAAHAIVSVVCGSSIEGSAGAKHVVLDHTSPMISQLASEVAHAAVRMKRTTANEVVKKILPKYEGNLTNPPKGKSYQDCFDIKTHRPTQGHTAIYEQVKKELAGHGLDFRY